MVSRINPCARKYRKNNTRGRILKMEYVSDILLPKYDVWLNGEIGN